MQIGRVTSVKGFSGRAEFISKTRVGDYIYYLGPSNKKVVCQVTSLSRSPFKGTHGFFKILDVAGELPKAWTDLYLLHKQLDSGYLDVGETPKGQKLKLRLNPFFRHVLIAGITQKGKTHLQIAIQEEFIKHKIPSIVFDTQAEFVHLDDALVIEEMAFEDIIGCLKQRKVVVYNLQGLSYPEKTRRVKEFLVDLMAIKEQDYKRAQNDVRLLNLPPIVVDVDEAEIYAPELYTSVLDPECKDAMVDIAKRGSKYGIGLMVASQRPPQLNVDVRSQCNSAIMFHINDLGSRKVMGLLPYISRFELSRVKNLLRGQCIITGELVEHPMLIYVRDIQTQRSKKTDFEDILGLREQPKDVLRPRKFEPWQCPNCDAKLYDEPAIVIHKQTCKPKPSMNPIRTQDGELVDPETGEVVGRVQQSPMIGYEDNLHVSKARTVHWGRPGRLGSTGQENRDLLRELKRK